MVNGVYAFLDVLFICLSTRPHYLDVAPASYLLFLSPSLAYKIWMVSEDLLTFLQNKIQMSKYLMWNPGLDEAQAGIKTAGRNINNLRYADDTTLRAERRTKVPLDESERGEWKSWLKAQHSEN